MTETKKTETPTAETESPTAESKKTPTNEPVWESFADRFARAYAAAMKEEHAEASAKETPPGKHAEDGVVFMPGDDKWLPDGT